MQSNAQLCHIRIQQFVRVSPPAHLHVAYAYMMLVDTTI